MFSLFDIALTSLANRNLNRTRREDEYSRPSSRNSTLTKSQNNDKRLSVQAKKHKDLPRSEDEGTELESENRNREVGKQTKHSRHSASKRKSTNLEYEREIRQSTRSTNKSKSKSSSRKKKQGNTSQDVEVVSDSDDNEWKGSMKNARKYKSVEMLKASSEESVDARRPVETTSTLSLKDDNSGSKVMQKQLYHELKRKQERARRSQPVLDTASERHADMYQDSNGSLNDTTSEYSLAGKKRPPVVPPKPKSIHSLQSSQGSLDSRSTEASRELNRWQQQESSAHGKKQAQHASKRNDKLTASKPRTKLEMHNDMVNEYFERKPMAAAIPKAITNSQEYLTDDTSGHDTPIEYAHLNFEDTKRQKSRQSVNLTENSRRNGQQRSHRT